MISLGFPGGFESSFASLAALSAPNVTSRNGCGWNILTPWVVILPGVTGVTSTDAQPIKLKPRSDNTKQWHFRMQSFLNRSGLRHKRVSWWRSGCDENANDPLNGQLP